MPAISIIIPTYNAERTIEETVQCVLKQSFSDFELIIINDGSTDSTLDVVHCIEDSRLQVFTYPNAGASISRNRGVKHSHGEYLAFLDSDDLWSADKLEAQLKALTKNPQAAVAYSWCDCIDEAGNFLRTGGHITIDGNAFPMLLLADILENGSNPLIRRQAFLEIGGFDESLPAGQDWDLYLRLAAKHFFITVPRVQVFYRISSNSMSANVARLESASIQLLETAYAQASVSLQPLKQYSLGNIYKYLTVKAFEGKSSRKNAIAAVKFLLLALKHDPALLQQRIIFKVLLRAILVGLFPPTQANAILQRFPRVSNTAALLMHIKMNP